jgi:hypothetical protein
MPAFVNVFGEGPLLGDEPPFLPGPSSPLETPPSLFHIYFSDGLPRAMSGYVPKRTRRACSRSDSSVTFAIEKVSASVFQTRGETWLGKIYNALREEGILPLTYRGLLASTVW